MEGLLLALPWHPQISSSFLLFQHHVDQLVAFGCHLALQLRVLFPAEIPNPFNIGGLGHRINGEGVSGPKDQIGILTGADAPDPVVDMQ